MDREARLKKLDPVITRFARRLREELGAERVILHGPYAMGFPSWESDYDLIIVAERYSAIEPMKRTIGLHDIFYAEGGHAPLSLLCLTPEEFARIWPDGLPSERDHPEALDLLREEAPTR